MRALLFSSVLALLATPARGDEARKAEARRLYEDGKGAFERHEWNTAYLRFRDAYMISQRAALLFNMASALKEDGRPGEAAESLRAYLRIVPETPDRVEINERILTLEESQRIIDRENKRKAEEETARRAAEHPVVVAPPPQVTPPPPPRVELIGPSPAEHERRARRKKIGLGVGLSLGGAAVIFAVIAIVASATPDPGTPTPATLGVWQATP